MSRIDYDLCQIKGIVFDVDGVLSPSTVPLLPNGTPSRMVNVKDAYALQLAIKMGYKIAIITGADCEAMRIRLNSLGVKDVYLKTSIKIVCLKTWIESYGLKPEEVAYIGDDIPDFECMNYVGLSISPKNGGEGVARDFLEQLLRNNGQWFNSESAFVW